MDEGRIICVSILILLSILLGVMIGQDGCQEPEPCECSQVCYTNVTQCLMELKTCQSDLNETLRFKEYYKTKLEDAKDG